MTSSLLETARSGMIGRSFLQPEVWPGLAPKRRSLCSVAASHGMIRYILQVGAGASHVSHRVNLSNCSSFEQFLAPILLQDYSILLIVHTCEDSDMRSTEVT